jgi:hypothetical protein
MMVKRSLVSVVDNDESMRESLHTFLQLLLNGFLPAAVDRKEPHYA